MNLSDPTLLELLRCPVKHSGLTSLSDEELTKLNQLIQAGELKDRNGKAISEELTTGLVNSDKSCVYAVRGEIIQLIADEAIMSENLI